MEARGWSPASRRRRWAGGGESGCVAESVWVGPKRLKLGRRRARRRGGEPASVSLQPTAGLTGVWRRSRLSCGPMTGRGSAFLRCVLNKPRHPSMELKEERVASGAGDFSFENPAVSLSSFHRKIKSKQFGLLSKKSNRPRHGVCIDGCRGAAWVHHRAFDPYLFTGGAYGPCVRNDGLRTRPSEPAA